MENQCTLQIFIDDSWRDAAALTLIGDIKLGTQAQTYLAYESEYMLAYFGRNDAAALSANQGVGLEVTSGPTWPAFLVDLLPQGYGRKELLTQLNRDENAGPAADWDLLCAGAGNPIGNVRIKEAHEWITAKTAGQARGFTMEEVAARASDFNEYLAQHGLFLAGSSGVQGEWPKILLTKGRDGLFHLDHALPDEEAVEHFIVKFGRGTDPALARILQLEAPYMQLARQLGLNVHADLTLSERALFIPRFDRRVENGRVKRFGQESVASLCELTQFGQVPSHNEFLSKLFFVASDYAKEIIEYVKRDIANVALGNTDNHARNTAIQRDENGSIGLTPLFDFAPMFLHPDGIARRMRWEENDGGSPVWASVIEQACFLSGSEQELTNAVKEMISPLANLMDEAYKLGIGEYLEPKRASIDNIVSQLRRL